MNRYGLNSALAGLALASLPAPALALEPKCPEEGAECWFELANKPGCHAAWKGNLRQFYRGTSASDRWSWSGGCTGGLASGEGILSSDDGDVFEGAFVEGVLQGQWSLRFQFAILGAGRSWRCPAGESPAGVSPDQAPRSESCVACW